MPGDSKENASGLTYRDAGVDIDAGNALVSAIAPLAESTHRPGVMGKLGGFGGLFDLAAAGYRDAVLVAATDGVGTKLKLAIETGRHDTIGIDLVAMCVNDLVVQGAEPLFFLDYAATGRLHPEVMTQVVAGIAKGCREAGAALIGGETAEMPGMYGDGDYDLAGFAIGAVARDELLPRPDVRPGDVLVGLPASGIHANGFSLVRRVRERAGLSWADPAPFAPETTLGDACLTPTRIYVKALLQAQKQTGAIKAMAHITGGGLPDNLPRILPDDVAVRLDLSAIPGQPVFAWLAETGAIARDEMLRTFNCGVGMVVVTAPENLSSLQSALEDAGEKPFPFGEVIPGTPGGERVQYHGQLEGIP